MIYASTWSKTRVLFLIFNIRPKSKYASLSNISPYIYIYIYIAIILKDTNRHALLPCRLFNGQFNELKDHIATSKSKRLKLR